MKWKGKKSFWAYKKIEGSKSRQEMKLRTKFKSHSNSWKFFPIWKKCSFLDYKNPDIHFNLKLKEKGKLFYHATMFLQKDTKNIIKRFQFNFKRPIFKDIIIVKWYFGCYMMLQIKSSRQYQ